MNEPELPWVPTQFRRHEHLVKEGEKPRTLFRVEEGWACRYRKLSSGRRQITALFVPGEYCEPQWLLGECATQPVVALTVLRASSMPLGAMGSPGGGANDSVTVMLAATLRMLRQQTEWIVSLGRKTAVERLCAFFSDIYERLQDTGRLLDPQRCVVPLTQADMADVVGLTPVHVNRVLQQLRAEGVIELQGKLLSVPDPERLARLGSGRYRAEPCEAAAPAAAARSSPLAREPAPALRIFPARQVH